MRWIALQAFRGLAVEPVFQHIQIDAGDRGAAEIVQAVVYRVELVALVGLADPLGQPGEACQRPAVNGQELFQGDGILCRIKVVEIA